MSVGVIVPIHGSDRYLPQTLDGILAQEPPPEEIVVVDDGSPIPTALDPRHAAACRLLRRSARGGAGAARDTGLDALSTDLVACADADDIWQPEKLRVQIAGLERQPQVSVRRRRDRRGAGRRADG